MSKLVRKPIVLGAGTAFSVVDGVVKVTGKKGALSMKLAEGINIREEKNSLVVESADRNLLKDKQYRAMLGTSAVRLGNLVTGVSIGFEKKLSLVGVGYKAQIVGKKLQLSLGYSHPVEYDIPVSVEIACTSPTEITLRSIDKVLLGMVAADIKSFRSVEPYQGKGIRYVDEIVFRKETKKKK